MKKFKIKSGDTVKVITGTSKNSEGKVLQIIKDKDSKYNNLYFFIGI